MSGNRVKTPLWGQILWAPVAVLLLHLLVYWLDVYAGYPNVDIPIHFLGGLALAHAIRQVSLIGQTRGVVRISPRALEAAVIVAGTALGAVLWEFGEFVLDNLIGSRLLGDLHDTLSDLLFGLLGASIYAVRYFRRGR